MAAIVVLDLNNVTVDGVPSGSVTDVLTNQKNVAGIRGDTLRALQEWHAALVAELQADKDRLRAQVDALGGTPLARQLQREARRAAAVEARARAEAEIDAIDAESPGQQ